MHTYILTYWLTYIRTYIHTHVFICIYARFYQEKTAGHVCRRSNVQPGYMLRSWHFETGSPCPAQHRGPGPSGKGGQGGGLFKGLHAMNCREWLIYESGSYRIDMSIQYQPIKQLASNFHLWNQDPTVFEGTIRFNIDPFDEFPDARLWEAVQSVQLMPYIRTLAVTWSKQVVNFSGT